MKALYGPGYKWEGRAQVVADIAKKQAELLQIVDAAEQRILGLPEPEIAQEGAGGGADLGGFGAGGSSAAPWGGGVVVAEARAVIERKLERLLQQAEAGGGGGRGGNDDQGPESLVREYLQTSGMHGIKWLESEMLQLQRQSCTGRHRGVCVPYGLCEELDHICGEPSLDQRLAAFWPNGLTQLPAEVRAEARQVLRHRRIMYKAVAQLRSSAAQDEARRRGNGDEGGGGDVLDGLELENEQEDMKEMLQVLEEELWERRARQEAYARLCMSVGDDMEKVSYALRNDPGAPWSLHLAVASMRQERRKRYRLSLPREVPLSAVIFTEGMTFAISGEDEDQSQDCDMWPVASPPWGNRTGSIFEEPSAELLHLVGLNADLTVRKDRIPGRNGQTPSGGPPALPSLGGFLLQRQRESMGNGASGSASGKASVDGAAHDVGDYVSEDTEGGAGWEPIEGVDDQDFRGPPEFECVHDVVRYKATRNTVLRLGPVKQPLDLSVSEGDEVCVRVRVRSAKCYVRCGIRARMCDRA